MKTTKYIYRDEEFILSLSDDCSILVSKDGVEAAIKVNEACGQFLVSADDGMLAYNYANEKQALDMACDRILNKVNQVPKKELCSRLEDLYEEIEG